MPILHTYYHSALHNICHHMVSRWIRNIRYLDGRSTWKQSYTCCHNSRILISVAEKDQSEHFSEGKMAESAPNQPIIVLAPTSPRDLKPREYKASASIKMGIVVIAFGIVSVCLGIGGLAGRVWKDDEDNWTHSIGTGIWCGCMAMVAGGLAMRAGRHKTVFIIKASLAMSIVAVLFGAVQLLLAINGLTIDSSNINDDDDDDDDDRYDDDYDDHDDDSERRFGDHNNNHNKYDYHTKSSLAIEVLLMLSALVTIGLCIATAHLAARVLCCRKNATVTRAMIHMEHASVVPIQMSSGSQQYAMLTVPHGTPQQMVLPGNASVPFQASEPPPAYDQLTPAPPVYEDKNNEINLAKEASGRSAKEPVE